MAWATPLRAHGMWPLGTGDGPWLAPLLLCCGVVVALVLSELWRLLLSQRLCHEPFRTCAQGPVGPEGEAGAAAEAPPPAAAPAEPVVVRKKVVRKKVVRKKVSREEEECEREGRSEREGREGREPRQRQRDRETERQSETGAASSERVGKQGRKQRAKRDRHGADTAQARACAAQHTAHSTQHTAHSTRDRGLVVKKGKRKEEEPALLRSADAPPAPDAAPE
eukprot:2460687-Rhodomonas_salina.1